MQTNIRTHVDSSRADINLQKYITKSKKRLQAILKRLQWSEELVLKKCNSKSDSTSTLLPDDEAEPFLPASFGTNNSVVIAKDALCALVANPSAEIPQRFSDLQCNFSREQKLEIYEHVVQNTEKLLEPELTVPINDESHRSMTFAEIVAIKKREKKQKRRKYRTSKPTHIEEVRNLVELQMQALDQYLNPDKVTPPRLCHRERDLLKQQEERSRSSSKDKLRKTSTIEELSKKAQNSEKRERRIRSVSRQRNLYNDKYPDRETKHKRRSRSRMRSISRERRHRNSSGHKSSPRDKKHRSRSRDRRHKRRDRSNDRRRQSRSKERKHKSRSRSKEKRHKKKAKPE